MVSQKAEEMNFRRKEIYMASVGFADVAERKDRPVLIISANRYNDSHPDVLICSMTTNSSHDCFLPLDPNALEAGEFYAGSGIRYDTIQRISKSHLHLKIGKARDEFNKTLLERIMELVK